MVRGALTAMRRAPLVLMFALALGVGPVAADENEPLVPAQQAEPQIAPKPHTKSHAKKPRARKPQARAHSAAKPAPAGKATPLPRPAPLAKTATSAAGQPAAPKSENPQARSAKGNKENKENKENKADKDDKSTTGTVAAGPFAGIPLEERLRIQSALFWSGDYTGAQGGEDPMLVAIKNFQKRIKDKVTGVLTPAERDRLVAAARDHERQFGWNVVVDPATGIRIGLPTRLVPQAHDAAHGTRWSSAHGEVQVETFRIKDPNLKLSALFDREKRQPATRKVEYSVLKDDSFFISGMQGLRKFSVRARARDGEVRGFTMLFDQAMEGIVEPVMVAMASAFSPFPERSAPFAALAKPVEYGNGIVVSARGHIVTDRRLARDCKVILAAGSNADLVAEDDDKGLALLQIYGRRKLAPLSLAAPADGKRGDLRLIGMPEPKQQNGQRKLAEIKARLADGAAIELREPVPMAGFSGAAALDAQGRFVGLMEMRGFVFASNEPAAPPVKLVSAASVREFLSAHGVPVAQGATTDAGASVVRVICVRK